MNLKNKILILKDGTKGRVINHDKYVYLLVNGVIQKHNYEYSFRNGIIQAVNKSIQKEVMQELQMLAESKALRHQAFMEKMELNLKKSKDFRKLDNTSYNVQCLSQDVTYNTNDLKQIFGIKCKNRPRQVVVTNKYIILISKVKRPNKHLNSSDRWYKQNGYSFVFKGCPHSKVFNNKNKYIFNAESSGKKIFLFVTVSPDLYYYQGEVKLVDYEQCNVSNKQSGTKSIFNYKLKVA